MVQNRDAVAMEDEQEIVCGLTNGTNINDLSTLKVPFAVWNLSNSYAWEIKHVLTVICLHMNRKARWLVISTILLYRNYWTSESHVIISRKWYKIETLLLQATNGKWCMAYWVMTWDNLYGHSPVAGFCIWDFSYSYAVVDSISADIACCAILLQ